MDIGTELQKTSAELEGSESGLENLMRWEDDGGSVFETDEPLPQLA